MPKDMVPAQKNQAVRANKPEKEILHITSISSYGDNLKALAKTNNDWSLTPEQIVSEGKSNRRIYRILFNSKPVRFSTVEEKTDTTYVYVQDHIIGILDPENTVRLKQLISSSEIHSVTCIIQGGLYKIVDDNCNVEVQQKGISAVIKIIHQPKAVTVPTITEKQHITSKKQSKTAGSTGSKKRNKKKKPFYKRVWIWVLAVILALGSCGKDTDTAKSEETTNPTTTITQTETTQETELPFTAEYSSPETFVAEISTIPTAPITEEPTVPYVAPVVENKEEIIVYLSSTGSKYHSKPKCGNMKNGTPVSLETVLKRGIEACQNCH